MGTANNWRKSTYSGPGDGDSCVEISVQPTCMAIRDSKDPGRATLTVPTGVFTAFVGALKSGGAPQGLSFRSRRA
ncbi:DUF397 domain-containing protein [Streptomyces sp. NBRC 110035]|uniref:DUF397 domain-containing protein n=1 Tax=Streptomyces sp. NBRC 110035 TaxID=1547867 RepID=UPI0005AA68D6|nr:DUF397 domain-containing protein [Streptomyces sp. NBRC 110035]